MDTDLAAIKAAVDLLDLIGRDTELTRLAATGGGEYAGPCPFCGGSDRLHVQPHRLGGGRWFCRQCAPGWGDAIDYVRRRERASLPEALSLLTRWATLSPLPARKPAPVRADGPGVAGAEWRREAEREVRRAMAILNEGPVGEIGREYLLGRGLRPATWQAWGLGYLSVWHPKLRAKLPAICLPWQVNGMTQAVQYRFIPQAEPGATTNANLAKPDRFSQRKGGQRLLFGLDLVSGGHTLVLCEGEINALSLWQVSQTVGCDVVSWGSQGNILRARVASEAARLARDYRHVIVWADEQGVAVDALRWLGVNGRGVAINSQDGLDANDRLQRGNLAEFMAAVM
ncbi:MAG TPA: primase-helicase zinc-binding domain-containing protein [Anaerolineae bacterium]